MNPEVPGDAALLTRCRGVDLLDRVRVGEYVVDHLIGDLRSFKVGDLAEILLIDMILSAFRYIARNRVAVLLQGPAGRDRSGSPSEGVETVGESAGLHAPRACH
ncbi:hypothetical protein [Streptomyces sp. NPDC020362]|uniref:hypothetical protein n=1 Tax=unclassified Streptomyces TaxID=2593676 RepID=UPI00341047A5